MHELQDLAVAPALVIGLQQPLQNFLHVGGGHAGHDAVFDDGFGLGIGGKEPCGVLLIHDCALPVGSGKGFHDLTAQIFFDLPVI